MRIVLYAIVFSCLFLATACDFLYVQPALTMKRQDYEGNLRMDGLYYCSDTMVGRSTLFLYRNGVVRMGCRDEQGTNTYEKYKCNLKYEKYKRYRGDWAVYAIHHDRIALEYWEFVRDYDFETFRRTGKVLNDTTILLSGGRIRGGKELDTFRFVHFLPKPDSTNRFVR
jgi:opacity protein-like surface antigen